MKSPLQGTVLFIGLTGDDSHTPEPSVPSTPPPTIPTISEESDPYVSMTMQIRLSTYLKLKRAQYWEPGFGYMREHVNEALATYLAQLPSSMKTLPAKEILKNKILRDNDNLLNNL